MRRRQTFGVLIGLVAAGAFLWYPQALAWLQIADPGPAERRAMAEDVVSRARTLWVLDATGAPASMAADSVASIEPGPCHRETEVETIGRSTRSVLRDARVMHLCALTLTDAGGQRLTAVIYRNQWVFGVPEGLHDAPMAAEPHELPEMLARIGR